MYNLHEKICLVTGGAQGIGAAVVRRLAQEGARVIIGDVNWAAARELSEELKDEGLSVEPVLLDVSSEKSVEKVSTTILDTYGHIDVLVNNAGFQPPKKDFWDIDEAMWDDNFAVNVKGVFLCSKAFVPSMISRRKGVIINTSSVAGLFLWRGSLHYIATKGAVDAMTRAMALELAEHNVRVNAVAPGHTDTALNAELLTTSKSLERLIANIPMRRIAQPRDLEGAYCFLASEKSEYITGHILYADGGLTQIK